MGDGLFVSSRRPPHLVGMHAIPQTTTAPVHAQTTAREQPKRLCGDAPALSPDRSNKHNHDRRRGWSSSRWLVWTAARKRRISSRHPATRLSSSGSLPSVLTRRLRNASSCCAFISAVDARRPKHAIADDLLILARGHRMADFLRQLLADHSPFPHAASPHRERHKYEERQEDGEPYQRVADECIEKPDVGRGLVPGRRLAFGGTGQREKERQCVVQHVCRDGKNEPDDRREDPDPPAPRLDGETKGCAENSGEHRVPTEP